MIVGSSLRQLGLPSIPASRMTRRFEIDLRDTPADELVLMQAAAQRRADVAGFRLLPATSASMGVKEARWSR